MSQFQSILVTNDDGINADGLSAMLRVANELSDDVWVIAPADEASQIGHRVTTDTPIQVDTLDSKRLAVHGTPADCVRLGIAAILPEKPSLVLSGINYGGNLGRHDFVISGTVAAAREAAFHGVPSVAISNFHRSAVPFSWESSIEMALKALSGLNFDEKTAGEFWNINLPHLDAGSGDPEVIVCEQESLPLELAFEKTEGGYQYAGRYHLRPREEGSDVDVCFGGKIAVSRVTI